LQLILRVEAEEVGRALSVIGACHFLGRIYNVGKTKAVMRVKASIGRIVAEANALRQIGIGTIAIMPNDTAAYREDSFDNMKAFAARMSASA
jgi:hypothetical protein